MKRPIGADIDARRQELLGIEQLRIASNIKPKKLCDRANVPVIQYGLALRIEKKPLSWTRIKSLKRALEAFAFEQVSA